MKAKVARAELVLGDQPPDHRGQFTLLPIFSFTLQFGGLLHVLFISGHDLNLLASLRVEYFSG
jgi:hypothetical protein